MLKITGESGNMAYKRNYKKEYKYQGTKKQIKRRAKRNAARAKLMKAGRVHKGDGKDVDHRKGVGAGNGLKNLRVLSKHNNRSFARTKKAGVKRRRK